MNESSEWVRNLVIVYKSNGSLDYALNQAIMLFIHVMIVTDGYFTLFILLLLLLYTRLKA